MTAANGKKSLTVREITDLLSADVLIGAGLSGKACDLSNLEICGVEFIERASESELAFVGCKKNFSRISATSAVAIVAPKSESKLLSEFADKIFLLIAEPEAGFLQVAERLMPRRSRRSVGISPQAVVAETASIGAHTCVHPFARIGEDVQIGECCEINSGAVIGDGCIIGDNVRIDSNAVIYPDVVLGSGITIHASTVIGSDGFGYRTVNGRHERLPHLGNVVIQDDVEIGACTTIDRAKVGSTVIGSGTRIDNAVMIAHNCQIGKHNILVGQTGIAGSSTTGQYVVCAGQSGIADHVHLGDGAIIGAKAGVHKDLPGGKAYLGSPASNAAEHAKEVMSLKRLPDLRSTVKSLKRQVDDLQQQVAMLLAGPETSEHRNQSREAA